MKEGNEGGREGRSEGWRKRKKGRDGRKEFFKIKHTHTNENLKKFNF